MVSKTSLLFCLFGILGTGGAWAQQTISTGTHATVKCGDNAYVSVTEDEEQAIPLQIVEKAACGEKVTVLHDPQGYTVKVRTAMGNVGYVARYEVAIDSSVKQSATAAASETNNTTENAPRTSREPSPGTQPKEPSKPHVYISDTASWTASGGFSRSSSVAEGALYGGYNPEMVDIYQDFTSDCSAMIVTQEKSKADFAVLFDKGTSEKGITGLGGLVKVNKVTVLSRSGATLLSQTAHSADTAVAMACTAVSQAGTTRLGGGTASAKAPR
jgi:hypothetical protein